MPKKIRSKIVNKCKDCAEKKRDERGTFYCPHVNCVFSDDDLKFWREVGGATLVDPTEGDQ